MEYYIGLRSNNTTRLLISLLLVLLLLLLCFTTLLGLADCVRLYANCVLCIYIYAYVCTEYEWYDWLLLCEMVVVEKDFMLGPCHRNQYVRKKYSMFEYRKKSKSDKNQQDM